jgi:hypothetical protein
VRTGDAVQLRFDALPQRTFSGRIDSLSPATGAQFALLPPDNATGNFTKVTQRVPVKILLDGPAATEPRIRPGLSVVVTLQRSLTHDEARIRPARREPVERVLDRTAAARAGGARVRPVSACRRVGRACAIDASMARMVRRPATALARRRRARAFDVRAAAARVAQAQALLGMRDAALWPSVRADPSFSRARVSGTVDNALPKRIMHNWSVPVAASYEVDLWGRLRGDADVGAQNVLQAAADRDAVRLRWRPRLPSTT